MSTYLGDFALGVTFDFGFCTVQSTGAPTTLSGSPVISIYPDNSTTELTAGITLSVDFDSRTGLNNVRVVATSGNGYATATNYKVVITTGTVNSISAVGYVVAHFSIENRSALRPATAGRTIVVDASGLADANTVKVGPTGAGTAQTAGDIMADTNDIQTRLPASLVGGRMDSSVGAMAAGVLTATAIAADAITDAKVASDVTIASVTGAVGSVTGLTASDVGAIKNKTDNLPSDPADESLIIDATTAIMTRLGNPVGASLSVDIAGVPVAILAAVADGTLTVAQGFKIMNAALGGKLSGAGTGTEIFRNPDDTKNRITATDDANGNRTAITLDLT